MSALPLRSTGPVVSMTYIDPRILQVDYTYQRRYNPKHFRFGDDEARELIELMPVLVSFRDGQYWIVDGQHRANKAIELEFDRIPASIVTGKTRKTEARMYALANEGARKPQSTELWKAKVVADDPIVRDIQMMLHRQDVVVLTGKYLSPKAADNELTAVGDLQRVVMQYGMGIAELAIAVLRQSWPGTPQLLNGGHIWGMAAYLWKQMQEGKIVVLSKQVATFRKQPFSAVIAEAKKQAASAPTTVTKGHRSQWFQKALAALY